MWVRCKYPQKTIGGFCNMNLSELAKVLNEQNKKGGGYQIHLNSNNLEESSKRCTDVEFGDLYFTECNTHENSKLLCFGNMKRKPVDKKEDGTDLYPMEINNELFIDVSKIEDIEDLPEFEDWFSIPSTRVINLYMFPENNNMCGNRNVVTIGFME